ncbi:MAG: PIN domain-containing protein [Candidatus Rokubacteria bacterium]|nr:PIN domain-containing protein [Candidatus Rokubacteria bacterium]MBI2156515.1 PIN domain-containing protein [Candidatus Rokubacteria bacterium]
MTALRAVFVDTGAWVALRYRRDQRHGQARRLLRRLRADGLGLVTTEWVLAEAVTLLKARGAVDHALALGEAIQAGRLGHLIESTPERRRRAWDLFVRYRDRRVGWVDCASFAVMEELHLDQVFGFDEDFGRAGFTAYR